MNEIETQFKKESIIACGNDINIYQIDPSRQYWFIRSDSGNYYNDFIQNDYVAIGWDYLLQNNFQFDKTGKLLNDTELKDLIDKNEKIKSGQSKQGRKATITKIFNKVYKFIFEVEEGDIVITPSENTNQVSIGIVVGALYEDEKYETEYLAKNRDTELTLCPFIKRRKIHWLKHISKSQLDIYLLSSFQSQEAMTNLNDCSDYINRNLYDAYVDKNCLHNIIKTSSEQNLTLSEITALFTALHDTINTISQEKNLTLSPDDIAIKINAHSPMILEMIIEHIELFGPYLTIVILGLGMLGRGITKYYTNKTSQTEETTRKTLEINAQENANKRQTVLELLSMRTASTNPDDIAAIDKVLEKLTSENDDFTN